MISRRAFAFALPAAALIVGRMKAAGVDGKWVAEIAGLQGNTATFTFNLKSDGEALTGTIENEMMGSAEIQDGKVTGDQVSFVETMTRGQREIRFKYEGKVSGDELELTRSLVRPMGAGPGGGQGGGGRRPGAGGQRQGARGQGTGGAGGRRPGGGQRPAGGQRPGGAGGGFGRPVTFTAKRSS